MEKRQVRIPSKLTFESAQKLILDLEQMPLADVYELDFNRLGWIEPFPMIQVARAIKREMRAREKATFRAVGYHDKGYARHMRFFRALGLKETYQGASDDHENYLPITCLNLGELKSEAQGRALAVGQLVEHRAGNIAKTLARQSHGRLWQTLQYALREIIRNSAEHGGCEEVYYCGQYWPERQRVEVAILDEGVGIATTLKRNPSLSISSDAEALRLAVLPGVSGTVFSGSDLTRDDEWGNSGFGLYVVSELCKDGGCFTLLSGSSAVSITKSERKVLKASQPGTALRLLIDTSKLRSIAASLELIVSRGERLARDLMKLDNALASGASKRSTLS